MEKILEIGGKHGLTVIEDAAPAHGSTDGSKKIGSFGDLSCFRFYPTNNLGGFGDGGIVLTNRGDFKEALTLYRNYGKKIDPFNSEIPGVNSRLDEVQAALLRIKLRHLDAMNQERAHLVGLYRAGLKEAPLEFLRVPDGMTSNNHILTILCTNQRDELARHLEARGIQTNVYYPKPLHSMGAYKNTAKRAGLSCS
jgi:dTDP-4-amino-4,6-dideoxygalactose transaminase